MNVLRDSCRQRNNLLFYIAITTNKSKHSEYAIPLECCQLFYEKFFLKELF